MHALYEPAGEDEENSVNVTIEKGMSKDEVMNTVLDKIKPYLWRTWIRIPNVENISNASRMHKK